MFVYLHIVNISIIPFFFLSFNRVIISLFRILNSNVCRKHDFSLPDPEVNINTISLIDWFDVLMNMPAPRLFVQHCRLTEAWRKVKLRIESLPGNSHGGDWYFVKRNFLVVKFDICYNYFMHNARTCNDETVARIGRLPGRWTVFTWRPMSADFVLLYLRVQFYYWFSWQNRHGASSINNLYKFYLYKIMPNIFTSIVNRRSPTIFVEIVSNLFFLFFLFYCDVNDTTSLPNFYFHTV